MKFIVLIIGTLFFLVSCSPTINPDSLSLIPKPDKLVVKEKSFKISEKTKICVSNKKQQKAAHYLQGLFKASAGFSLEMVSDKNMSPDIVFEEISGMSPEAYILDISPKKITISASDESGYFYGVQTIRQLLPKEIESKDAVSTKWFIPCVEIEDNPRFKWRGMHMDFSRHFFTMDEIKTFLDYMALYKLNTYHMHLTDDQGWRIEIKKYPLLTEKGAWRTESKHDIMCNELAEKDPLFAIDQQHYHNIDGQRMYGGFFTQEQIKEIIRYASDRCITVIPEIDMPGHFKSAIDNYPHLSCTGEAGWGNKFSVPACLGQDDTYTFVENILSEIAELFPAEYIHIGGDEVNIESWTECKKCQKEIKTQRLHNEHELQTHFNKRIEKFLHSKGKKLMGWDEIAQGGLSKDATMMWWRNWAPKLRNVAAENGNYMVMTPDFEYYFDFMNHATPLKKVYNFEPIPSDFTDEQAQFVLGVQANLWSEKIANFKRLQYQTFPRMLALAETGWTKKQGKDFDDFSKRIIPFYERMDEMDIHYYIPPVNNLKKEITYFDAATIELKSTLPNCEIYYTTDGSEPTKNSTLYNKPFSVNTDTEIRSRIYRGDVASEVSVSKTKKIVSEVENYNVSWNKLSKIASDAMPLGNGTTGVLVSVLRDGHIWLSLRHVDAWSEAHRLLKLGDIELTVSPNPFSNKTFKQELVIRDGVIFLEGAKGFRSKIWIDANHEVIHVENNSDNEFTIQAKLHSWRKEAKIIRETNMQGIPGGIEESADVVVNKDNALVWYHRNNTTKMFEWTIKALEIPMSEDIKDVLKNRTFGAWIGGNRMIKTSNTELTSNASKQNHITIHTHVSQSESANDWLTEIERKAKESTNFNDNWKQHKKWWNSFWDKSYIYLSGSDDAKTTSAGYAYAMYLNAMAGNGEFPIIWNGSMFAPALSEVPQRNHTGFKYFQDPDHRSWGNLMLHQNVRLPFYSMNAAGQFDYTQPFIDLYMRGFPIMKDHTKAVFGHEGTVIRESTTLWGVIAAGVYGVDREGLKPGQQKSVWHQTHWNAGLEVAWYLAEHYEYLQRETFARDTFIPFASEVVKFFDVHWPHRNGKLYFPDVHCLESFRKVDNPMPFITGLMCVIERLLALPENITTEIDRRYWKEVYDRIPEIPTWEYKGKTILANAEVMKSPKVNVEVSELYSVFPYYIYGIGKPDLELAQRTYQNRSTLITEGRFKSPGWSKGHIRGGWHPESIMAAMVGLTDSVKMEVIWALHRPVPEQRFPGFFKSTHDGVPDVQHSSVAATALQRMILQDVGNKIVLAPAFPDDWNCEFKLYAKQNTIVEGKIENGTVLGLRVTPESRKEDIYIGQEMKRPNKSIWE